MPDLKELTMGLIEEGRTARNVDVATHQRTAMAEVARCVGLLSDALDAALDVGLAWTDLEVAANHDRMVLLPFVST